MSNRQKLYFEFGPFQLDSSERVLLRNGEPVAMTQKAFETLLVLVQNSGRLLQKDEMLDTIWPNTFVEECTLFQNIFALRKVLGETAGKHRYIETVPRRGYRFIARVSQTVVGESNRTEALEPAPDLKSIAVLPFQSLNSDKEDQYFGIGMADALITKLSNIRKVVVRPTSAVLKYNGDEHSRITAGKDMKVDLVLEGRILRSADKVRVTAQLVDVVTGAPLWADKFDEYFTDIFALHDKISERVTDALTIQLTNDERERLAKPQIRNSEAHQLYLKGRYQWNRWTEEGFLKSIECFHKVIEIDPNCAIAYAGLSDAYSALAYHGYVSPIEAMPKSKASARRALQIDNRLAEASFSLASCFFLYDWDWLAAEKEFCRAIDLSPAYAIVYQGYGLFLTAMGRFDKAQEFFNRAIELDPVSLLINTSAGFHYYYSRRYDEALNQWQKSLEISNSFGLTHLVIGNAYVQKQMYDSAGAEYQKAAELLGRTPDVLSATGYLYAVRGQREEAREIVRELRELHSRYVADVAIAIVYAGLGESDSALEWLEKGYETRSNKLVYLNVNPVFDGLRADTRFKALLKRVSL